MRIIARCVLLAFAASSAFAQFEGQFSLPKRTYPAGDRGHHIMATFTVKNVGSEPLRVPIGDPNICTGYFVEIIAIRPRRKLKPAGIAGDCLGPNTVVLAPGESRVEKVDVTILDYNNFLDAPGDYKIRLVRYLRYTTADSRLVGFSGTPSKFAAEFIVHMEAGRRD